MRTVKFLPTSSVDQSFGYDAGSAGPHAVTSATIDGVLHTLTYDPNGAVTKYDISGTNDDKYIAYNANNQPTKIVIGNSLNDTTPVARDEFAYDPDGQRYARKTTWQDGANTYTEEVAYIGPVEVITDNSSGNTQTITKTQISENVMHVKIVGTTTVEFFEYAHRDHLGSIEAVTDDNGNVLDQLAFEPFGSRKKKNWTANISASELHALLDAHSGNTRKARGFTGHEHLDRTGFIHMNGRVYDPVLGRFLSPDPIIQLPSFSQGWNSYSYVLNTPSSLTDPSGLKIPDPNNDYNSDQGGSWGYGYDLLSFAMQGGSARPDYFSASSQPNRFANEISQTGGLSEDQATSGIFADVVDFGGLFAGAALLNVISGDGTRWRGYKNWKWNSIDWGGNGFTGARRVSLQIANGLKLAGHTLFFLGAANSIWEGGNAAFDGDKGGVVGATGDLAFGTGATFGGPVGLVGGASYFVTGALVEIPAVRAAVITPIVDKVCALSENC